MLFLLPPSWEGGGGFFFATNLQIRKIRCDAAAEGCSHCTQQHLECYVTDRVTGRTERRGYLQQLEREKNSLLTHIRDLEKLLKDKGVAVRPFPEAHQHHQHQHQQQPGGGYLGGGGGGGGTGGGTTGRFADLSESLDGGGGVGSSKDAAIAGSSSSSSSQQQQQQQQPFGSLRSSSVGPSSAHHHHHHQQQTTSPPLTATATDTRVFGGAYLGVALTQDGESHEAAPFGNITGTQLSILGTTIDLTLFDAPDMDGPPPGAPLATPLYNKSLQSFYNSVAKVNPPMDAPLPSREDAFNYSEWFFVMVGGFMPVLHKPSHFKLVRGTFFSWASQFCFG